MIGWDADCSEETELSEESLSAKASATHGKIDVASAIANMRAVQLRLVDTLQVDRQIGRPRMALQASFKDTRKAISLALERAWQAILELELSTADAQITHAELALLALPCRMSDRYREALATIRAACLIQKDESLAALALITRATQADGKRRVSDAASAIRRYGYWKLGDIDQCCNVRERLSPPANAKRTVIQTIFDLSTQSAIELEQFRFPSAKRLARDAFALAESIGKPNRTIAALPASILAQLLYDEGCLNEADALIAGHLAAIRGSGTIETCIRAYSVLSRLALRRRQFSLALQLLHDAESLGARRKWSRLIGAATFLQIEVLIECMQMDNAEKCLEQLEWLENQPASDGFVQAEIKHLAVLGRCRVSLARGLQAEAILMIRQAYHGAAAQNARYRGFHLGICLIQALAKMGATAEAVDLLFEALKVGATVGLYQAFLDAGADLKELLLQLHEDDRLGVRILPAGVRSLVISLIGRGVPDNGSRAVPTVGFDSSSCISKQEAKILSYISAGYSNKRIAKALNIAPETVKSHVKNIFIKLSVGARAEAVARGGALGLICPLSRI